MTRLPDRWRGNSPHSLTRLQPGVLALGSTSLYPMSSSRGVRPRFAYGDQAVVLRPESKPKRVASSIATSRRDIGSVVVSVHAEDRLPGKLIEAAAVSLGDSDDALVYVLGDGADFSPETLLPFRRTRHLNLNVRNLSSSQFLAEFTSLHSLTIQGSTRGKVRLSVLEGMRELRVLSIPSAVTESEALADCPQLTHLHCSSSSHVISALAGHPALEFLEILYGTNRDLASVAQIRPLIGLAIYQIRGLTGDDLMPIGDCEGLRALSLGGLRNVSHLTALRGKPRYTLQALLLEELPNLESLSDVASCEALEKLGMYGSRPRDKSLRPLSQLKQLAHLVLGDPYPVAEITALTSWYSGALRYRNKIARGDGEPLWRTPIDGLA